MQRSREVTRIRIDKIESIKEERIGFDNQLAAIERTLRAKEKDLEELVLMSHDAQHAKEMAKAELSKLELQIAEERRAREKVCLIPSAKF